MKLTPALLLLALTCVSSFSTFAKSLPACAAQLQEPNLRTHGLTSREAIRRMIEHLAAMPADGETKYRKWLELVHTYNRSGHEGFIITPCLKSVDGDHVCWGQTRGHLLVFRPDGAVFSGFDPARPTPLQGANGYRVDWSDPSLRQR